MQITNTRSHHHIYEDGSAFEGSSKWKIEGRIDWRKEPSMPPVSGIDNHGNKKEHLIALSVLPCAYAWCLQHLLKHK